MCKSRFAIILLVLLPMIAPFAVQGATITACTFDKNVYHQGDVGFIAVTIYNDKDDKIRVTEITATIDYFYADETVYLQTFFTNATLPVEIRRGQSSTLYVLISLPTNIASGYIKVHVGVKTELWNSQLERWFTSDQPTYGPVLYVESPYKHQFEQQQTVNQQLQEQISELRKQLQEVQAVNNSVTIMMYILVAAAVLFALMMVFVKAASRRARVISQPAP